MDLSRVFFVKPLYSSLPAIAISGEAVGRREADGRGRRVFGLDLVIYFSGLYIIGISLLANLFNVHSRYKPYFIPGKSLLTIFLSLRSSASFIIFHLQEYFSCFKGCLSRIHKMFHVKDWPFQRLSYAQTFSTISTIFAGVNPGDLFFHPKRSEQKPRNR